MISICIITYNHGQYIRQTLESVLSQQTSYPYEIVIGEDLSSDATRQICEEYAAMYPQRIRLLPTEKNLGMMQNFLRTVKACRGKYIAFCEGDDYWTDTKKIQKQVSFLEENPAFSACFHNAVIKNERKGEEREWTMHPDGLAKDVFTTEDVLGPWFIASASFVFVNYPDFDLPAWYNSCQYGDLPYMLLLSLRGPFKYLNETMCVYRLHGEGATTLHHGYDKIMVMVYIYYCFDLHTGLKFHSTIRQSVKYEVDRHSSPPPPPPPPQKKRFSFLKNYVNR